MGIVFALCLFSTGPQAGVAEAGEFKVSSLRIAHNGVVVRLSPAPAGCQGGESYRMHLKVPVSDPNHYSSMVAGLLTAHTTGQTLRWIWYTSALECDEHNILNFEGFEYTPK